MNRRHFFVFSNICRITSSLHHWKIHQISKKFINSPKNYLVFSSCRTKTTNRAKRSPPKMLCCCGASERLTAIRMSTFWTLPHRGVLVSALTLWYTHIDPISLTFPRFRRIDLSKILIMHSTLQTENWAFHDFSTPKTWSNRVDLMNGTETLWNLSLKPMFTFSRHSYLSISGAYISNPNWYLLLTTFPCFHDHSNTRNSTELDDCLLTHFSFFLIDPPQLGSHVRRLILSHIRSDEEWAEERQENR